jgi:hypothetical protein
MSKLAGAVLAGVLATAVGAAPALARDAGDVVCTVTDPRAIGLSGLVATADGYVSVVDGQFDRTKTVIVYLDHACKVVRVQSYPASPRDPEDLAVAPDGTLWSADIGDNFNAPSHRSTIAVWRVPPGGGNPVIYRMTYPDGWHDAEALLFAADGTPVVVTKEIGDTSFVYQATRPLEPGTPTGVPMRRVGEFHPRITLPTNDIGRLAELLVTGAAMSPDRRRVALRTYAAAYEWDVPDGDVVKAITTGTPRITPLDNEPQGESIAYTVDGQFFLTVSDQPGPTPILRYRPAAAPAAPTAIGTVTATVGAPGPFERYRSVILTVDGVALVVAVLWIVGARRRQLPR